MNLNQNIKRHIDMIKLALLFLSIFILSPCIIAFGAETVNTTPAQAETAQTVQKPVQPEKEETGKTAQDSEQAMPEQPVYPGVKNLIYKLGSEDTPKASIYYPSFGNEKADKTMRDFAQTMADAYEKDAAECYTAGDEKPASFDMWELTGLYSLEKPDKDIVSVTFNIYSYTGGAHGNIYIHCINYDLKAEKELELSDLFSNQEKALQILSSISIQKLKKELGDEADEEMIQAGASPEMNNFLNLSLNSKGLFVEFQPYQVGPWSIGTQRIEILLDDLLAAGPNPAVWPNAVNLDKK